MAYGITITTKATVGGITDSFPLGAAVTGMTPGEQYTVQWANDKGIVFEHNDLPVIQSLDDGTVGTNSGTQMARATTAQAVKFTANLMYRGVKVKSSTPVTISFQALSSSFKFTTDKLFAPSIGYGILSAVNIVKVVVTVTDSSENPVEGAEVQWLTSPATSTLHVYQDASGTKAPTDGGIPFSLSATSTGEATAYFADDRSHQYLLTPQVLGSGVPLQSTVVFAGTDGETANYKSFLVPGIDSDSNGHEYLNISSDETQFMAQPRDDVRQANQYDSFFALMNDSLITTTTTTIAQLPPEIPVGYAALKPPLTEITQNVPPADMNQLVYFVQDAKGSVSMSTPFRFYSVGEWAGNVPDLSPNLNRILNQAQVAPPSPNFNITTDTIDKYHELRVYLPILQGKYSGKTATVLFYLNGYYKNDHKSGLSGQERHSGPDSPGLTMQVPISAGVATKVVLPYPLIFGYALGPKSQMAYSYIDYYIDLGNGQLDYSVYPIEYGTDTDYP